MKRRYESKAVADAIRPVASVKRVQKGGSLSSAVGYPNVGKGGRVGR